MEPIRRALPEDQPAIETVARRAYGPYIAMIGRPPASLTDDYARRIAEGAVHVIGSGQGLVAFSTLVEEPRAIFLETLAVVPEAQGRGHGRSLLAHAEAMARATGRAILRIHGNVVMVGPVAFYAHAGFVETGRGEEDGYRRVWMEKRLA